MKTKIFFAACLLFCMALPGLKAQTMVDGTRIVVYNQTLPGYVWVDVDPTLPGYEDELLNWSLVWTIEQHWENGVVVWQKAKTHGIYYSTITQEKFESLEIDHYPRGNPFWWNNDFQCWLPDKFAKVFNNLRDDQGHHYILWYNLDWSEYRVIVPGKK